MNNNFKYTNSNKRYHTLDYYYKNKFNSKIFKVSLNANFSCPNIDGTVGYGGCIYCSKSGSGEFAGNKEDEIVKDNDTADAVCIGIYGQIVDSKKLKENIVNYT